MALRMIELKVETLHLNNINIRYKSIISFSLRKIFLCQVQEEIFLLTFHYMAAQPRYLKEVMKATSKVFRGSRVSKLK
jgi:hypothetical protein